ncbi:MAG: S41 family peptidase [Candidatus Dormibacteria bacterium]
MSEPKGGVTGKGPTRSRLRGLVPSLAVVLSCYLTGLAVVNLEGTSAANLIHSMFPRVERHNLDSASVNAAWADIQQRYVVRSVDGSVGTAGAEQGMIEALKARFGDRFSAYLTPAQAKALHSDLAGQRSGSIGIALEARCDNGVPCAAGATATTLVIEDVLRDQPAARAGLLPGDILVAVDGRDVRSLGKSIDDRLARVSSLIRGSAGTSVRITTTRAATQREVVITRRDLSIPSVFTQRFGNTLYLQVTGFDETTGNDARHALQQNVGAAVHAVILDLRHNGGGYVSAAQRLASQFVAPGPGRQDVVVRRGRLDAAGAPGSAQTVVRDTIEPGGVATVMKTVVLVDGDSASAAEIVTACLHDYGRATVVGLKTFGKGSVQEDFTLPDGGDLHLTVEKWFGPRGESIDNAGIQPDQSVALDLPEHRFMLNAIGPDPAGDAQLQAALVAAGP